MALIETYTPTSEDVVSLAKAACLSLSRFGFTDSNLYHIRVKLNESKAVIRIDYDKIAKWAHMEVARKDDPFCKEVLKLLECIRVAVEEEGDTLSAITFDAQTEVRSSTEHEERGTVRITKIKLFDESDS